MRGGLDDLAAVFVLGRTADDRYLGWSYQWLSRRGCEKRKKVNDYDKFIAASELTLFDGGAADIDAIVEVAERCAKSGELRIIGIDSYGATELAAGLAGCGAEVVSVPQSWKLTPAITWIERRIADGRLRHSGAALLRWNIGNVVMTRQGNAVSISKAWVVGAGKIDGVAAMLNAVAACISDPEEEVSVYETKDLLMI
jgi:phage terminase large subunit-like protein